VPEQTANEADLAHTIVAWLEIRCQGKAERPALRLYNYFHGTPLAQDAGPPFRDALTARLACIAELLPRVDGESLGSSAPRAAEWLRAAQSIAARWPPGGTSDWNAMILDSAEEGDRVLTACVSQSLRDGLRRLPASAGVLGCADELAQLDSRCWAGFPLPPADGRPLDAEAYGGLAAGKLGAGASPAEDSSAHDAGNAPAVESTVSGVPSLSSRLRALAAAMAGEPDPLALDLASRLRDLSEQPANTPESAGALRRKALSCLMHVDDLMSQSRRTAPWAVETRSKLREILLQGGEYVLLGRDLLGRPLESCARLVEAAGYVDAAVAANHIAEVQRPGYALRLSDGSQQVLRPARVLLAR
jgi:hypothetical protein